MSRTIMIMAGGTGGHIFPAMSVAEELRGSGWNVVWLGNRKGMEGELIPGRVLLSKHVPVNYVIKPVNCIHIQHKEKLNEISRKYR